MSIYLDNSATSFPKAPGVGDAMKEYIDRVGVSVKRTSSPDAGETGAALLETRELLCALFNAPDPRYCLFTPGATYSLNMLLKGFLRPGDHVIVSAAEHNAVMRPLSQLENDGVSVSLLQCDGYGRVDPSGLPSLVRSNTRLVLVNHVSNVTGTVQPIDALSRECARLGVPFALDASQSAGHIPLDFSALGLCAICVPGHKGLLGPQGIGALILEGTFAKKLSALVSGGTGSASDRLEPPAFFPDRLEPGTPNIPGIYGLRAALKFVAGTGVDVIEHHENSLARAFEACVSDIPGVRIVADGPCERGAGIVSLCFTRHDNASIACALSEEFGIATRCGLHCAPMAHKALATFPYGTVRFSFGLFNSDADVRSAALAVKALASRV